ncbi:MAG TPA: TPM domain-containing protein [Myxococcus sp.]|nr:TPM domain-containing protein [Myxococcus sp.]
MHRIHRRAAPPCLWSLLALLALASPVWALAPVPAAAPPSWVHDGAGLLTPEELTALTTRKEQLEQQTGVRLVVLTLASAGGESPKDIAVRTLNEWNAGRKSVLLLVLMSPRELYIQPGTDLATVLDSATASAICSKVVAPRMRGGEQGAALREGLEAIAARAQGSGPPLPQRDLPPGASAPEEPGSLDWLAWLAGLGAVAGAGWGLSRLRGRKCQLCGARMKQSKEVITRPTYTSAGRGRRHYQCRSCGLSFSEEHVIAQLGTSTILASSSESSSSSDSSSSSSSSSTGSGGGGSSW